MTVPYDFSLLIPGVFSDNPLVWGKPNIHTAKCNVSNYVTPIYLIFIVLLNCLRKCFVKAKITINLKGSLKTQTSYNAEYIMYIKYYTLK